MHAIRRGTDQPNRTTTIRQTFFLFPVVSMYQHTIIKGLALLLCTSSLVNGMKLMHKTTSLHPSIKMLSTPPDDHLITLTISLALQNINQLGYHLQAVSEPSSPKYGAYLDLDDIDAIFAPSEGSRAAVHAWLNDAGVEHAADDGYHINFATTISSANLMLNAYFQFFDVDGVLKLRTREYSIPGKLAKHIDLISPTTFFGRTTPQAVLPHAVDQLTEARPLSQRQTGAWPGLPVQSCTQLIEPLCLMALYNFPHFVASNTSGSRVGFTSFLNQSAMLSDLHLYQRLYDLPVSNFSVVLINGGVDYQYEPNYGGNKQFLEANLDSQFLSAVTMTLPVTEFITGGKPPFIPSLQIPDEAHNTNEPYLEFFQAISQLPNADIPQVISNSYADEEQSVPPEYAGRVCTLIGMLGLRGISIITASGDTGVGATCLSNTQRPEFTPQFPSTCPYITSIGGTQFSPSTTNNTNIEIEAWPSSSGGFSNYFSRAWYQEHAVQNYLAHHLPNETRENFARYVNFSGRGFPDLSAHSANPYYSFFAAGRRDTVGGTSAAAPVVAGLVTLLNSARLKTGRPTMGFLNPWLYSLGTGSRNASLGLVDVTKGASVGCTGLNLQSQSPVPGAGRIPGAMWNATVGWDPVTGLGYPDLRAWTREAIH